MAYFCLLHRILFFIASLSFCCSVAQETVFIGSYNKSKAQEGIYVYTLDILRGKLKKCSSVKVHNSSFIDISPNGKFLYACTETLTPHAGSVCGYAYNSNTKKLKLLNCQPSGGENPVYLTIHKSGKWIVNGNYTEGSISVHTLDTDGSMGVAKQVIPFSEGSVNKGRQDRAHIHATVFSPQQDRIFFTDLGADKIRCFIFDSSRKEPLLQAQDITVRQGSGPRHMAFDHNGRYAYCIDELSGCIEAYKYDSGKLEHIQQIAAHRHSTHEDHSSADIHLSPDGKYLYASNRADENNIAIFSVSNTTGYLKNIGYQSVYGDHPRMFALNLSGKFLLVANQISGNVIVFRRNKKTGY